MPKGLLSKVPWPRELLDDIQFSSPTNTPHGNQLVSFNYQSTTLTMLYELFLWLFFFLFFFLKSKRISAWPHQSTIVILVRTASHIKVTRPPCLFQLLTWENVNRSVTLVRSTLYVSDVIHKLFIRKVCDFADLKLPTLNQQELLSYVTTLSPQDMRPPSPLYSFSTPLHFYSHPSSPQSVWAVSEGTSEHQHVLKDLKRYTTEMCSQCELFFCKRIGVGDL